MRILLTHIKELVQIRESSVQKVSGRSMRELPSLENAFLLLDNDRIAGFGTMNEGTLPPADKIIQVAGKTILPTWCDSHTHIVYAGHREQEFVDRIKGLTYQEIAAKGGGILNSAKKLRETSEDILYEAAKKRVEEVMQLGTGALEIKSGYGLTLEAELKMLRVIQRLKQYFPIPIKATFLGAHAIPAEFKEQPTAYVDQLVNEWIPVIAQEQLADFIDVFCEKGYFNLTDTERILEAGTNYGLSPKIHVNQFNAFGGVALGIKHQALSVDHLEELTADDVEVLQGSNTMPVALPGCSFFLGIPYTPARTLIDAGIPLALASDYNPGSAPSGNMNFVVSAACVKMRMTPEEAINAATLNGAYAMNLSSEVGSISVGKKANFILTKEIPSHAYLPYSFGHSQIEEVWIDGKPLA